MRARLDPSTEVLGHKLIAKAQPQHRHPEREERWIGILVTADAARRARQDDTVGFVLGKIQIALKLHSIDYLWFNRWTDRDKAELKRLCEGAAQYYAHAYGQKVEEVPESSKDLLDMIEKRCTEIAEHHSTAGNDPPAASSTQHIVPFSPGAGHYRRGEPRHRWSGF